MNARVAIVLPYFGNGGAENMVSRLAAHIDLNSVETEVICVYGEPQNNSLEQVVMAHGIPIKYIGKNKGFSFRAVCNLWKELSEFRPTVVHTHLSACVYCAPWVVTHKVVMLHTIHNTPEFELIKPKRIVMSCLYHLHKAVPVAISHEIQSMTVDYYRLSQKPELIYNPVDVRKFAVSKKPHKTLNFVTAGRLSAQKNQKMLIKAFSEVAKKRPDVRLTILGDGPLKEDLEKQIRISSLEDKVQLMGNVDNVEDYFAEADIFALSSAYEGLPLVVLEAMAAGLPVISTNVGGVKDIVTDNGILVNPQDCSALADALMRLLNDEGLRKQMGLYSFANVQQYDSNIIAEKYISLYEKYSAHADKEEK